MLDSQFQRAVERVAEERIRHAMERGEFDALPGAGQPLPDVDAGFDELWWVRKWTRRENASAGVVQQELNQALRTLRAQREAEGEAGRG